MAVSNLNDLVTQYGNVSLIDPNSINVNQNITNGIPQYQDMHIFAELTGRRKQRTVLETFGKGNAIIKDVGINGNDFTVNFIGNNQNDDLNFTTNWYDNNNGEIKQYEGFGISNIKVIVNSSYIPQVNIEFIDLRGQAFFNQTNSPYRILFDFPPPIFELKLKGYYGMALSYKLHLLKYTSEFKSETGNYIINAQFVALTYAPLTDILFRYIINFPLIQSESISINPNAEVRPKNTYELILKLKNLYTQYNEKKNTNLDTLRYNNIISQIEGISSAMDILNNYNNNDGLKKIGNPVLLVRNISYINDGGIELTKLNNIGEYDGYIKAFPSDGTSDNVTKRLYITYLISSEITIQNSYSVGADKMNVANDALKKYRQDELINRTNQTFTSRINENDIPLPNISGFTSNQDIVSTNPNITNLYAGLDITNYYIKLYKQKTDLSKQRIEIMSLMNDKINDMVIENLGMKPTIYNIFELILNDVDTFFKILRTTSNQAEEHHKTNFNRIINGAGYADTGNGSQKQIFAFPLVIKKELGCNNKDVRTAPIELNKSLYPNEFPEMILVKNFIETFTKQQVVTELLNMRGEQNADGTYKWIPISPVDSKLATSNLSTPYYGIDTTGGGASSQPINLSNDNRLTQVFEILLKRFYILTQSSFPYDFYDIKQGQNQLVGMFSQSESINLASSITNQNYGDMIFNVAKIYSTDNGIENFYNYVKTYLPQYYAFSESDKTAMNISGGDMVYVNKKNPDYKGFTMYNDSIVIQDNAGVGIIETYQRNTNLSWWEKFKNGGEILQSFYKFTNENVFYIKDGSVDGSDNYGGINTKSRFIANLENAYLVNTNNQYELKVGDIGINNDKVYNRAEIVNILKASGNSGFTTSKISAYPEANSSKLNIFGDIVNIWVDQLSKFDTEIYGKIINYEGAQYDRKLSALLLSSNFGYTLSPFNIYPHNLNKYIFNTPAVVEVPAYIPYYMGALSDIDNLFEKDIYDFFITGPGRNIDSSGAFIFADIYDIRNSLSKNDKENFKTQFEFYYGNSNIYKNVIEQLKILYDSIQPLINGITDKKTQIKIKKDAYEKELNASTGNFFKRILIPLLVNDANQSKNNIVNFSQLTFSLNDSYNVGYQSLETINKSSKKNVNDNYFKKLFQELVKDIKTQQSKISNKNDEYKKMSGDDDIITQTYYSFKNINDKWLTNPEKIDPSQGYPFNTDKTPRLIDSFVFVDRAMNPIGNTVINPEILIELMNDPNVSVFSVISQLLSMNGFEFFPLQNFMSYQNKEWENSFKITTDVNIEPSPAFVCMYIGGSSRYPTGIGNMGQYVDDGILDISAPGVGDFSTDNNCESAPDEDAQEEMNRKNNNFKYRKVHAFRVKFGEQNQSMFKDIKIDSKEHPETNESIQILSRLAGDNKLQAPPPIGQNLYNLYENRSYKATISGLGNMMIQPTQYFQLENIPMYNGAYIILGVEHTVEPNKMTTVFNGTKILKYPIPRVLHSSAIVGFDGGNTDLTNVNTSSANDITVGYNDVNNFPQAQYNSMYTFKI